jgi:ribonuclease P protein component
VLPGIINPIRLTFGKEERLSGTSVFSLLFKNGHTRVVYPVRLVWIESPQQHPFPSQVAFAVPRKNFKNAVDRNLLKRQMREAFRINKASFYEACGEKKLSLLFIYIAREVKSYHSIERSICIILGKLTA